MGLAIWAGYCDHCYRFPDLAVGHTLVRTGKSGREPGKAALGGIYAHCIEAAGALVEGGADRFVGVAEAMFEQASGLAAAARKKLGDWDAAMRVYDGAALWQ